MTIVLEAAHSHCVTEAFPSADSATNFGSAMRTPLGIHLKGVGLYPLVDPETLKPLQPLYVGVQVRLWGRGLFAKTEQIESAAKLFPDHSAPKEPVGTQRDSPASGPSNPKRLYIYKHELIRLRHYVTRRPFYSECYEETGTRDGPDS